MILMGTFEDHDVDSDPVIVLGCGHVFSTLTLDNHMGMAIFYPADGPIDTESMAPSEDLQSTSQFNFSGHYSAMLTWPVMTVFMLPYVSKT